MDQISNPVENNKVSQNGSQQKIEAQTVTAPEKTEVHIDEVARADNILFEQPSVLFDPLSVANISQPQDQNQPVVLDEAAKDEISDTVNKKDEFWIGKAKEVIKENQEKPYEETEAAENLEQKYLKVRFNIDVTKDENNNV